ncbi:hypothetical protein BOFE_09490 (plasmid) [Candidatus Borrelia fainii]|uniref:Lipoprotein n=1 Tax=Candidatus Borrelia fainii TaxID=2518322 RepID=A0ABM8DLD9_9SPIR|nr:hypothetical protein [Candidatus Borrelia fainii]BDU63409.1 hypothetical protein BOFE_09490 [Candidatus Borrelia fainii]
MVKIIYHNVLLLSLLLLMLLMVISCNLKPLNKLQGDLHGTSHSNNFEITPKFSLDEFLNSSRLLKKEQAAVQSIRTIVTNSRIGSSKNYRTYTDSDFFSLLNDLGIAKVEEMITVYLEVQKKQEEALVAVKDIGLNKSINNYLEKLDNYKKNYPVHLKGLFNKLIPNDVYVNVIGDNYITKFIEIIDDAKAITEILKYCTSKSVTVDESTVLIYILNILVDPLIGKVEGYKTYKNSGQVFFLFGSLGLTKVKEIIKVHVNSVKAQSDAEDAIKFVKDEHLKQQLQNRFDTLSAAYSLYIKEVFGKSSLDDIYKAAIVNVNYDAEFNKIKNEATIP